MEEKISQMCSWRHCMPHWVHVNLLQMICFCKGTNYLYHETFKKKVY
jgi:hypothetical protein